MNFVEVPRNHSYGRRILPKCLGTIFTVGELVEAYLPIDFFCENVTDLLIVCYILLLGRLEGQGFRTCSFTVSYELR